MTTAAKNEHEGSAPSQIWGVMFAVFETLGVLGYYLWAWAQGGVDD